MGYVGGVGVQCGKVQPALVLLSLPAALMTDRQAVDQKSSTLLGLGPAPWEGTPADFCTDIGVGVLGTRDMHRVEAFN